MSFIFENWPKLLEASCEIPTDVQFHIIEKDETGNKETPHFQAHKMALALASPVFKRQFFGTLKETSETITIKKTTIEAFSTLMDYVYMKELNLEVYLEKLFEVINLAEKYDMSGLRKILKDKIAKWPISMENVVEDAVIAAKYQQFEESKPFLTKCSLFLKRELKTPRDIYQFIYENADEVCRDTAFNLLNMINFIDDFTCINCNTTPCQHEKPISSSSMYRGCKVVKKKYCTFPANVLSIVQDIQGPFYYQRQEFLPVNILCYDCEHETNKELAEE